MLSSRVLILLLAVALAPVAWAQPEARPVSDPTASGGPLLTEQAAYDVTFYDLALRVDPASRSLEGRNVVHARITLPTSSLVLDLDTTFAVSGISEAGRGSVAFERHGGRLWLDFGRTLQPGETVQLAVDYAGRPRVAPNPPWIGGFTWVDRPDGTYWAGVSVQGEGADLWWPVKDHPSDQPDSMRVAFTVPDGHEAISNGRLLGIAEGEGERTFEWFISTPINNYNVTLYLGPFETLEADYTSVTGEPIPFTLHVLPEVVEKARRQLPQFVDQMRFMEERFGPYPFRQDKYAVVHAPYLGMEHQTAIAYGDRFEDNAFGFDWLHLHELAHEWFGNLVTVPDWSHFWVHEGFAMFVEALYAEHVGGLDAYHRYMRERMRQRIVNQNPVVPQPGGDTQSVYFGRTDATDQDVYFKGAWFLHTLRWTFRATLGEEAGETAFARALRRVAYPDPALEAALDCAACRFATTEDVQRVFEVELGEHLEELFRVYLYQPVLPRVVMEQRGPDTVLRWETPPGYLLSLPLEVEIDGERRTLTMEGGEESLALPPGARLVVDPDLWILKAD